MIEDNIVFPALEPRLQFPVLNIFWSRIKTWKLFEPFEQEITPFQFRIGMKAEILREEQKLTKSSLVNLQSDLSRIREVLTNNGSGEPPPDLTGWKIKTDTNTLKRKLSKGEAKIFTISIYKDLFIEPSPPPRNLKTISITTGGYIYEFTFNLDKECFEEWTQKSIGPLGLVLRSGTSFENGSEVARWYMKALPQVLMKEWRR